jgi:hypothetical protein
MSRELKMYRNTVRTVDIFSICDVCSRRFCVRLNIHPNALKKNKTTIFAGLTPCILVSVCQNARRRMLRDPLWDPRSYRDENVLFSVWFALCDQLCAVRRHQGLCCTYSYKEGRDSVVGVATRYGLDGPGIASRWRRDFPYPSRPVLGPTQPPVQCVPGVSRG